MEAQCSKTRKQKVPGILMSGSKIAHHLHQIPLFKIVASQPNNPWREWRNRLLLPMGAWPLHAREKELMADIFPDRLPPKRKREFFRTKEILSASTALREIHSLLLLSGPMTKQQNKI